MVFGKLLPPHCHSLPLGQIRGLTSERLVPGSLLSGRACQGLTAIVTVAFLTQLFDPGTSAGTAP